MKAVNLQFIQKRRQELGLSLQEMAEHIGFKNASNYMKYERGEYAFKADHLPILAKHLQCELEDIFFEEQFAKTAKNESGTKKSSAPKTHESA